jgi:hypothetical protein
MRTGIIPGEHRVSPYSRWQARREGMDRWVPVMVLTVGGRAAHSLDVLP